MSNAPQTITLAEANAMLEAINGRQHTFRQQKLAVRDYCMTLLMFDAGLRVGEVVQLLISDLLIKGVPVTAVFLEKTITKTKTERLVPLSPRAQRAIELMRRKWWMLEEANCPLYAFYFNDSSKHLTVRQVQRIIEYYSELAIGRAIHPHVLRHTFASRMMRVTNARVVQQLLGHKSLTSTQVYTHPNNDDLQKAIDMLGTEAVSKTVDKLLETL